MIPARIQRTRCVVCRRCIQACVLGAIRIDGDSCVVDEALCVGCGACGPRCRTNAILTLDRTEASSLRPAGNAG